MISRLIFRKQSKRERQASCFLIVIVLIILAVFMIKITDINIEPPTAPLLPPSSSLIQFSDLEQAQAQTNTQIYLPQELFNSTLHTIGLYQQKIGNLTAGSVIIILKKGNWRFAEIVQRPGRSLAEELSEHVGQPRETIQLGSLTGIMLHTDLWYEQCINPQNDGTPGFCLITHKIFFEMNDQLITVAGDQNHITEGELISLARSIIETENVTIETETPNQILDETATQ